MNRMSRRLVPLALALGASVPSGRAQEVARHAVPPAGDANAGSQTLLNTGAALTWDSYVAVRAEIVSLWFLNQHDPVRYTFDGGAPTEVGLATSAHVVRPEAIGVDASGNVSFGPNLLSNTELTLGNPVAQNPDEYVVPFMWTADPFKRANFPGPGPNVDQTWHEPGVSFWSGMTYLQACSLMRDPDHVGHNPYRSNSAGTPKAGGDFLTYQVAIVGMDTWGDWTQTPPLERRKVLGQLKVQIVVAEPYTPAAHIHADGTYLTAPFEAFKTTTGQFMQGIEPSVTADGRLLVFQGGVNVDAQGNSTGTPQPGTPWPTAANNYALPSGQNYVGSRIAYSYRADPQSNAGWSVPRFLSALHTDENVVLQGLTLGERYPVARHQLFTSDGVALSGAGAGAPFYGAYPWIHESGFNVVCTTTLGGTPGLNRALRGGVSIMGEWTHRSGGTGCDILCIDTNLNPDREGDPVPIYGSGATPTNRLLTNTLGDSQGLWRRHRAEWGGSVPTLPVREGRRVTTLITATGGAMAYGELDLGCYGDPDTLLRLAGNEVIHYFTSPNPHFDHDPLATPDSSGHRHLGVMEGAGFPTEKLNLDLNQGRIGQCFVFSAPGDRVRVTETATTTPGVLGSTSSLTAACFVKFGTDEELPGPLDLIDHPGRFTLSVDNTTLQFRASLGGANISGGTVDPGVWQHVALVVDGIGGASLVVDGVIVTSGSGLFLGAATGDLCVGESSAGSSEPVPFEPYFIDEVFVWGRPLNLAQIARAAYLPPTAGVAMDPSPTLPFSLPPGLENAELFVPTANPLTAAKVTLGQKLFFDAELSVGNGLSCGSCHTPPLSFTDGQPLAQGVGLGSFSTPPSINRLFSLHQLHDGRAATLEDQVLLPITNPLEMGSPSLTATLNYVNSQDHYTTEFGQIFGGPADPTSLAQALASYLRSLVSGDSPFDQSEIGQHTLSPLESAGRELFFGKARCVACHSGPNFSDERFWNIGTATAEIGRMNVTQNPDDLGAMKTPTLRDIALTGPHYFHDGHAKGLVQVVETYNQGGVRQDGAPSLGEVSEEIRPLGLSDQEITELVAFLNTLTGASLDRTPH